MQFYYWYEVLLAYLILSAVPLILGTLCLFIMTYYKLVVNLGVSLSKIKYILFLALHYICAFILTSLLALIFSNMFNSLWLYAVIVECIIIPFIYLLFKSYLVKFRK